MGREWDLATWCLLWAERIMLPALAQFLGLDGPRHNIFPVVLVLKVLAGYLLLYCVFKQRQVKDSLVSKSQASLEQTERYQSLLCAARYNGGCASLSGSKTRIADKIRPGLSMQSVT